MREGKESMSTSHSLVVDGGKKGERGPWLPCSYSSHNGGRKREDNSDAIHPFLEYGRWGKRKTVAAANAMATFFQGLGVGIRVILLGWGEESVVVMSQIILLLSGWRWEEERSLLPPDAATNGSTTHMTLVNIGKNGEATFLDLWMEKFTHSYLNVDDSPCYVGDSHSSPHDKLFICAGPLLSRKIIYALFVCYFKNSTMFHYFF